MAWNAPHRGIDTESIKLEILAYLDQPTQRQFGAMHRNWIQRAKISRVPDINNTSILEELIKDGLVNRVKHPPGPQGFNKQPRTSDFISDAGRAYLENAAQHPVLAEMLPRSWVETVETSKKPLAEVIANHILGLSEFADATGRPHEIFRY